MRLLFSHFYVRMHASLRIATKRCQTLPSAIEPESGQHRNVLREMQIMPRPAEDHPQSAPSVPESVAKGRAKPPSLDKTRSEPPPPRVRRPMYTRADIARLSQFSERQLAVREKEGRMPRPRIADHKAARYDPDEIDDWLDGRWVAPKQTRRGRKRAHETAQEGQ
jgi:hypothetical protein